MVSPRLNLSCQFFLVLRVFAMVRGNPLELFPSKLPKEPTRPQRILVQLLRPFHLPIEADWDWRDLSSGRIGETTAAALRFQDLRADPRCFLIDSFSASLASNLIETVELSAAAFVGRETADR